MSREVPEAVRVALAEMTRRLEQELGDNLVAVHLFGSHARGEARPDSDVDVLVLVKEATVDVRWQVSAIAADVGLDHDLVIATLSWDTDHLQQHQRLNTLILRNLQAEGVVLWTSHA